MIDRLNPPVENARPASVIERIVRIGLVVAQLLAVLMVARAYRIGPEIQFALLFATGGFVVSALLPLQYRLRFFAGLSIAALVLAVGPGDASLALSIGALLVVSCHLPVPFAWRVSVILIVAIALGMLRSTLGNTSVIPVLASMFMFRLILYLYEVRYRREPFDPVQTVSYFSMFPNSSFPLFPVVDHELFRRRHFDADELATYETGARWIIRGLLQLLVRRLLAFVLAVDDLSVNDLDDLLRFLVAAFATYLDVSGAFHIIVGALHLFGFRLPPTHHRYLLATSLPDLWRRINIYWKDFMVRLVYYPSHFALRRRRPTWAGPMSTAAVFLASWGLHSYQQFWLTGTPRLTWQDTSFWAMFAGLVVWATTRARTGAETGWRRWDVRRGLATLGTMTVVLLLWSYWAAQSVATWFYMWTKVRYASPGALFAGILGVTAFVAIAGYDWGGARQPVKQARELLATAGLRSLVWIATAILLTVLATPGTIGALPTTMMRVVHALRSPAITARVLRARVVGYYEAFTVLPDSTRRPWSGEALPAPAVRWDFREVARSDFLVHSLRPGFHMEVDGKSVLVNSMGFRDRERELTKAANTMRLAVIGPSYVVGWGVSNDETFTHLMESTLDSMARASGYRAEVLNLSATEWTLEQSTHAVTAIAGPYRPDLTLLAVTPGSSANLVRLVLRLQEAGIRIPDSALAGLLEQTGIHGGMSRHETAVRLRLIDEQWNRLLMSWMVRQAAAANSHIAVVELRMPGDPNGSDLKPARRAAASVGIPWLDCSNAYAGDEERLKVGPNDRHPNAEGHRMIARCLESRLAAMPALLPVWFSPSGPASPTLRTAMGRLRQ